MDVMHAMGFLDLEGIRLSSEGCHHHRCQYRHHRCQYHHHRQYHLEEAQMICPAHDEEQSTGRPFRVPLLLDPDRRGKLPLLSCCQRPV